MSDHGEAARIGRQNLCQVAGNTFVTYFGELIKMSTGADRVPGEDGSCARQYLFTPYPVHATLGN